MRPATITAASLEVSCPVCGEPQPSPDNGSHIWTTAEVISVAGTKRTCVSCDVVFVVVFQNRVGVSS